FIPARIRPQGHIARAVVGIASHIRPTEFDGFHAVLKCLIYVEDGATFGAQQPLVPVGGQSVDVAGPDVEWKCAKSLNRIYKINAMVTLTNLTYFLNWCAVSAEELHEADGQQSSAAAGLVDLLQGIVDGEPRNLDPFCFQALPRVHVGRKLFEETHHAVAGLPIQPESDGGDALGGVLDQRDLAGIGIHQAGGRDAETMVDGQPLVVVEAAV